MPTIHFEKATLSHQAAIFKWLDAPHVKEFWDNSSEHREDILLFINGRKAPSPYSDGIFTYWVGTIGNEPYCLLMTSDMFDSADLPSYYRDCLSKTGKTCTIDFMIGNDKYVDTGLAAPTLEAFTTFMQKNIDPIIDTFMIDPEEANSRAKHVYEKAGFQTISEFVSTQSSGKGLKHFLMIKKMERPFLIRQANANDIKKIEQLMKLSMQELGQGHYTPEQIESSCKYVCVPDRQIIEDGTFYVVEDRNGEMVGCGGWSFRYTLYAGPKEQENQNRLLDPQKDMARIRAMFVLSSVSGKGVGSLILKTSEQAAKKAGFNRGALTATQSGFAFYKAKGWIPMKKDMSVLPDGVKIEITHMEKDLT